MSERMDRVERRLVLLADVTSLLIANIKWRFMINVLNSIKTRIM